MINKLEILLKEKNSFLIKKYEESIKKAQPILDKYQINFPDYTDHGIHHANKVAFLASELLKDEELNILNADEIYVLLMACLLHDIGMGISQDQVKDHISPEIFHNFFEKNPSKTVSDFIRRYHHELSYSFIIKEFKELEIPSEIYAEAIALIAKAHREIDLRNFDEYKIKYYVKSGSEFICLPYLGCIIRIADGLDITDDRISELVLKYYPPKNDISAMEIEKHRATFLVNFEGDTVIVRAKCYNQYVYNALISLYKNIKKEIKKCQKIILSIGKIDNKLYKLNIRTLNKEIITEGFIPKDIGFNIDIDAVFNHFISQTLYNNPYIAIREVIQNAIDTCQYKNSFEKNYNPIIKVILDDDKLIVEENGIGMDEFIIKEFFGKLGSSYYKIPKVMQDFESIADFGIGIFSYFLICDHYEVETKMKDHNSIKFKVYKDPKINFYFIKDFFKNDEGTRVIFFLNEDIKQELTYNSLIKYIKNFIRDVDFSIRIISDKKEEILEKDTYEIKVEEELNEILLAPFHDKKEMMNLLTVKLENDNFRGIYGIFLPLDKMKKLQIEEHYKWINYSKINIDISHKGIYVTDVKFGTVLKFTIGRINLLNKTELNLNRTNFLDENLIFKILKKFEIKLLKEIFNIWSEMDIETKYLNSNNFLTYFVEDLQFEYIRDIKVKLDYINAFNEVIILKVFSNSQIQLFTAKEFLDNYLQFVIIPTPHFFKSRGKKKFRKILKQIYKDLNLPLVFTEDILIDIHFLLLLEGELKLKMVSTTPFSYMIVTKKVKKGSLKKFFNFNMIKFENDSIIADGLSRKLFLNEEHAVIKFWNKNKQFIEENSKLNELIKFFLKKFQYRFSLIELNNILAKINIIMDTNLELQERDLPQQGFIKLKSMYIK